MTISLKSHFVHILNIFQKYSSHKFFRTGESLQRSVILVAWKVPEDDLRFAAPLGN